jgi:hypothetical protein
MKDLESIKSASRSREDDMLHSAGRDVSDTESAIERLCQTFDF